MESLMNEYVEHKKYGHGLIIGEETGNITVKFDSQTGNRIFQFPEAFEQFLVFQNELLEEKCLILLQAKKEQLAEENERKRLEYERQEVERKIEELEEKNKKKKTTRKKETKVTKQTVKK